MRKRKRKRERERERERVWRRPLAILGVQVIDRQGIARLAETLPRANHGLFEGGRLCPCEIFTNTDDPQAPGGIANPRSNRSTNVLSRENRTACHRSLDFVDSMEVPVCLCVCVCVCV